MDAIYTGSQIAQRRKALGMTQKELAEKLHVTDKAVSKWERGINFPDLGILEALAKALNTSPVSLLGLEEANQEEMIRSITEVSEEQLEEAKKDLAWTGWGSLLLAAALVIAYQLFGGKDVVEKQRAYQVLHTVITIIGIFGLYLLFKYQQIKKLGLFEILTLYTSVFGILLFLGYQFLTGHYPPAWFVAVSLILASSAAQLLFYKVMTPKIVKALPLLACILFLLWQGFQINLEAASCLLSCAVVYFLCILKKREGQ